MSDTTTGGGKRARKSAKSGDAPKRQRKTAEAGAAETGGRSGARSRRKRGGEAGARTFAYASAAEAQKAVRRAISSFAKAGATLDLRMDGSNVTVRGEGEQFDKLARKLKPKDPEKRQARKAARAAKAAGAEGEGAADGGAEAGSSATTSEGEGGGAQ